MNRHTLGLIIGILSLCFLSIAHVAAQTTTSEERLKSLDIGTSPEELLAYLKKQCSPESDPRIQKSIDDLAADDFLVREQAMEKLLLEPIFLSDRLKNAILSSDPEQAWRAKRISERFQDYDKSPLSLVLRTLREKQIAVAIPTLLILWKQAKDSRFKKEIIELVRLSAQDTERELVEPLLEDSDPNMRKAVQGLITAWSLKPEVVLKTGGKFFAVQVKPGNVSGGGQNIVDGWEFIMATDVTVTHLGLFDQGADGFKEPHEIAIWNLEDKKAPVVHCELKAGKELPLTNGVRYQAVEPIVLKAGVPYAVVAHFTKGGDNTVGMHNPTGLTLDFGPLLEVRGRRYSFPHPAMAYPKNGAEGAKHAMIGPSFQYEVKGKK